MRPAARERAARAKTQEQRLTEARASPPIEMEVFGARQLAAAVQLAVAEEHVIVRAHHDQGTTTYRFVLLSPERGREIVRAIRGNSAAFR